MVASFSTRPSQCRTQAVSAEHVVTAHSVVGSSQGTAQTHLTEFTGQTHGRLTLEVKAGTTVVRRHSAFQHEFSLQAVAQIFHAAEAQTAGSSTVVQQARNAFVALHVSNGSVHHAVQGDGRLSHCGAGSSHSCQSDQRFLHLILQGLLKAHCSVWCIKRCSCCKTRQPPGGEVAGYCTREGRLAQRKTMSRRKKRQFLLSWCNTRNEVCPAAIG